MTNFNRTFLGIDYGSRRVGLAKSDPTGMIAGPLTTLEVKSVKDTLEKIEKVLADYDFDGIVVGYPLHESGEVSKKCLEIDAFIEKLAKFYTGPIHRTDERYSSLEAEEVVHAHGKRVGQDKKRIDRLAAVIILQRYLEENPGGGL